jgi:RNA polymerase sigma-70 factor (ECF subfamily)
MLDDRATGFTEAELMATLPALQQFARRFHRGASDVDDLVQETLTKAIGSSHRFQRGSNLRSWLFTIMRNTFCTKYKLSRREQVGGLDDCAGEVWSPPTQDWKLRAHELERAIDTLPRDFRLVVDLVLIQGMSYELAAERCDVPVGTIKSRVSRARARLAGMLG